MKFTSEDVKLIERFIEIKNRGFYCDGGQLTEVYNRVLEKNVPPTSCGSCMRARISELENALNQFKRTMKVSNSQEAKEDKNNDAEEAKKAIMRERMAKAREAKKNKTN